MDYNFNEIEQKWREHWKQHQTYKVTNSSDKPKYYVLDMFPYPSGAGLHVGHPLGYIASDIYSRFKRHQGFNVLHPMGFDAFGLPAEQYAIQTGQHPRVTTENNIVTYKRQLANLGFCYDWDREVSTHDPQYYKWTQWIFLQLFKSWYNKDTDKAESIDALITQFEAVGNTKINAACGEVDTFDAAAWKAMTHAEQQDILQQYRLAYQSYAFVNWCPALGTVLANDEVQEGVSVRGGHPVERKSMKQWFLRITAYAQRLLDELDHLDWTDSMKDMQRNWIGRSEGAEMDFPVADADQVIRVFTTRPDTVFGATFMVLAPEHELVAQVTTPEQKDKIDTYVANAGRKSERERQENVKTVTGEFTGGYCINPFTNERIPIWVGEYVLAGYGTGAIMCVPAHDSRDYAFATHFNLPIIQVVDGEKREDGSYDDKEGKMINSGFLDGLEVKDAIAKAIDKVEEMNIGTRQVNFRLRDAAFSRQRYWGEPFPIYYKDGVATPMDESELPLTLPEIESYKPTPDGEPPLARAKDWEYQGYPLETDTMPGYAGSSWYWFRYMDPENDNAFVAKAVQNYWTDVDLYIGGAEHATGHLVYSRCWSHFLYDLGYVTVKEPFKKLINQGMIQGRSLMAIRLGLEDEAGNKQHCFIHQDQVDWNSTQPFEWNGKKWRIVSDTNMRIPIEHADLKDRIDRENFQKLVDSNYFGEGGVDLATEVMWSKDEHGKEYLQLHPEVEKMSKSMYNVVNPDDILNDYGADTFRMYEMFLGPIEIHKPWDTKGIEGVHRFLKKFWRLFFDKEDRLTITDEELTNEERKLLHNTIKKVTQDIERFAFNTAISAFMVCTNELNSSNCTKRAMLEPLVVLLSPFAPHAAEELWVQIGKGERGSVTNQPYPTWNEEYIKEDTFEYPIAINGKVRAKIDFPLDMAKDAIEQAVISNETIQKWLEGKPHKKFILVPGRMINLVV